MSAAQTGRTHDCTRPRSVTCSLLHRRGRPHMRHYPPATRARMRFTVMAGFPTVAPILWKLCPSSRRVRPGDNGLLLDIRHETLRLALADYIEAKRPLATGVDATSGEVALHVSNALANAVALVLGHGREDLNTSFEMPLPVTSP